MRRFRLQLMALFAVLAILMSGAAAAQTRYRCLMSGRIFETCCCAEAGRAPAAHRQVEARVPDCCEPVVSAAHAGATATLDVEQVFAAAFDATVPIRIDVLPRPAGERLVIWRDRGPPGVGPPLFIKHCSLLS